MNRIVDHLLKMYPFCIAAMRIACCHLYKKNVITTYFLRVSKHQVLKRSIYFSIKVRRNHCRSVNHPQTSTKCFVARSIDKFYCQIITRQITLVVEGRACEKQIDYFRASKAGKELYRS